VLALRAQFSRVTAPLPPSEQALLGGSDSLRGYATGYRAGDNLAAVSAELRVPFTSPLRIGRFGVKAFVDAGTVWPDGERLANQRFDRGIGGGVYAGIAVLMFDLDVAWPESGGPRVHVGMGVTF
jgi:hemolysin activation/secretion protein